MSTEPVRSVMVTLRVRTKGPVSPLYGIGLRKLAQALTGKGNVAGLLAWCERAGVGVDLFRFGLRPGGEQGTAWLDGRRANGIVIDRDGNVVATLTAGKLTGDRSWASWLELLPDTSPIEWGSAPPSPSAPKPPAPAPKGPVLTARVDLELTARSQAQKLTAVHRAQLEAASKELCGKKGLAALLAWCDAEEQGLAHLVVSEGKTPRFEGWLTAPLEDGVFFDAGQTKLSGLVVSEAEVDASRSAREPEVAALQQAMKRLKAPRAPRWRR